jgi:hypothetical protein
LKSYFVRNEAVQILCEDNHPDRMLCWEGIEGSGHKLAVLVDLEASGKKIKSSIEKIIKKEKEALKSQTGNPTTEETFRSQKDIWTYSLIAYDLTHSFHPSGKRKYKVREISDIILGTKDHFKKNHTSECKYCRKIRRYKKEAEQLINGKYKIFLTRQKTAK